MVIANVDNKQDVPMSDRLYRLYRSYISGSQRAWVGCRVKELLPLMYFNEKYKMPEINHPLAFSI